MWDVDVIAVGEGRFLVVAEVEAPTVEAVQAVTLPPWVGREVTGEHSYTMSRLLSPEARRRAYEQAYASTSSPAPSTGPTPPR